jgi:hypothetical protein
VGNRDVLRIFFAGEDRAMSRDLEILMRQATDKINELIKQRDALVAALERSNLAMNDWVSTYAAEMCNEADVAEARKRINEFGTLGYIGDVLDQGRAALKLAKGE